METSSRSHGREQGRDTPTRRKNDNQDDPVAAMFYWSAPGPVGGAWRRPMAVVGTPATLTTELKLDQVPPVGLVTQKRL